MPTDKEIERNKECREYVIGGGQEFDANDTSDIEDRRRQGNERARRCRWLAKQLCATWDGLDVKRNTEPNTRRMVVGRLLKSKRKPTTNAGKEPRARQGDREAIDGDGHEGRVGQ